MNKTSGEPLYEQLAVQIKNQIIDGTLKKDEALPSIRVLAADLNISVITTKRAYEDLAGEGVLYSMPAKGYFVAEINRKKIEKAIKKTIELKLKEICAEAKKINLTVADLYDILEYVYV